MTGVGATETKPSLKQNTNERLAKALSKNKKSAASTNEKKADKMED